VLLDRDPVASAPRLGARGDHPRDDLVQIHRSRVRGLGPDERLELAHDPGRPHGGLRDLGHPLRAPGGLLTSWATR